MKISSIAGLACLICFCPLPARAQAPTQPTPLPDRSDVGIMPEWKLEINGASQGTSFIAGNGVVILIDKIDPVGWHVQFERNGVNLANGVKYVLQFRARASAPRLIAFYAERDSDYRWIGVPEKDFNVTPIWQTFSAEFTPYGADPNHARITFMVGQSLGRVDLSQISLLPAESPTATSPIPPLPPGSALPVGTTNVNLPGPASGLGHPAR